MVKYQWGLWVWPEKVSLDLPEMKVSIIQARIEKRGPIVGGVGIIRFIANQGFCRGRTSIIRWQLKWYLEFRFRQTVFKVCRCSHYKSLNVCMPSKHVYCKDRIGN